MGTDGVLLAQGGSSAGYALYLKDSKLIFALRSKNKLHTVESRDALPATTKNIVAKLSGNGNVELFADSKTVATGNVHGLLEKQPQDGLQVGQDTNGTVGDYAAPNKFNGEIASAKLDLSGK